MTPLRKTSYLALIICSSLLTKAENLAIKELASAPTEKATEIIQKNLLLDNGSKLLKAGFTPLIGDSLESWKIHNDKPEVQFTLKDGVISGVAEKLKGNSFLFTQEEYGDFLLYFEFRFDHMKGNSGIMYRSHYKENKSFAGLQFEMDNAVKKKDGIVRQWTGLLYAENAGGWLYPNRDRKVGDKEPASTEWQNELSAQGHEALDETGWNVGVIRVQGPKLQTWLNGVLRTDFLHDSPKAVDTGHIALQIHGGRSCAASWRNMYILPIESEDASE